MVVVVRAEAVNGWRQIRLADGRLGWLPPGVTRKLPR
jgi:SH3-like domain-containing protein